MSRAGSPRAVSHDGGPVGGRGLGTFTALPRGLGTRGTRRHRDPGAPRHGPRQGRFYLVIGHLQKESLGLTAW